MFEKLQSSNGAPDCGHIVCVPLSNAAKLFVLTIQPGPQPRAELKSFKNEEKERKTKGMRRNENKRKVQKLQKKKKKKVLRLLPFVL